MTGEIKRRVEELARQFNGAVAPTEIRAKEAQAAIAELFKIGIEHPELVTTILHLVEVPVEAELLEHVENPFREFLQNSGLLITGMSFVTPTSARDEFFELEQFTIMSALHNFELSQKN